MVKSSQAKSLQLLVMSKIPMTDAPTCECDQRARECEVFWTQANGSPEHETRQVRDTEQVKTCNDQLASSRVLMR